MNSGEIQYNDLISLEKNASGGVAALVSNMAEFNPRRGKNDFILFRACGRETPVGRPWGGLTPAEGFF